MSTETKAVQTAPAATLNQAARFIADISTAYGRIAPHFDPNNPTFKMLTAGYLFQVGSTIKDPQLKAVFQKEVLNLF